MGLVDISGISTQFFVLAAFLIMLVASMFSLGVLRSAQKRYREATISFFIMALGLGVMVMKFF